MQHEHAVIIAGGVVVVSCVATSTLYLYYLLSFGRTLTSKEPTSYYHSFPPLSLSLECAAEQYRTTVEVVGGVRRRLRRSGGRNILQ